MKTKMKTTNLKTPLLGRACPGVSGGWGRLFLLLFILGFSTAKAQVALGTTEPDASAILELDATDRGFLPPRLTSAQRDAIAIPVEGLMIYNTNTKCLQVYDGRFWISACNGVADVPTVLGANGVEWMDRNLGASQVATSSTDADSYGDLYQWGRATDGHEKRNSSTTTTLSSSDTPGHGDFIVAPNSPYDWRIPQNDNLWQGTGGTNNPCPAGYRVPTDAEWDAERLSWSSNNAAGAFASPLKLPSAGVRLYTDGSILLVGSEGYYWSSTDYGTSTRYLLLKSSGTAVGSAARAGAGSVRCLKD